MPDAVSVRMNLPDFRRELRALGTKLERRIVRAAVRDAGKVFVEAAQQAAPRLRRPDRRRITGALRGGIVTGPSRFDRRKGVVKFFVGVKHSKRVAGRALDPFYWRFLEGGWIPRGPGRKLRGGAKSRSLQRERVLKAGGRKARYPFFEPAFRRAQGRALAAFTRAMDAGIAKARA